MTFYIMDMFLITLFFYVAAFIEGVNLKLQTLVHNKDIAQMSEQFEIKMINEIIEDHNFALDLIKSLEQVVSSIMLSQFVLFSYSFCFVMFNFTLVMFIFVLEWHLKITSNSLFQISDKLFLLSVMLCFVIVTQVEQFVFSYLGGKITDEVSHC